MEYDTETELHHRSREPGDRREWGVATLASLAGVASVVWLLASAWIGFRDGVLTELAGCAHRAELIGAKLEQYYHERDPWIERIKLLERQREQDSERLQQTIDRIRDLELGKRP